jgi:nitrate/nitrite-specific signal transduction histidine kinase
MSSTVNDLALAQATLLLVQMAEQSGDERIGKIANMAMTITKETAFEALLKLAVANTTQQQQAPPPPDDFDLRQQAREDHAKQMREMLLTKRTQQQSPNLNALVKSLIESIQNERTVSPATNNAAQQPAPAATPTGVVQQ